MNDLKKPITVEDLWRPSDAIEPVTRYCSCPPPRQHVSWRGTVGYTVERDERCPIHSERP